MMSSTDDIRLFSTLQEVFGFSQFREHQELAVRSILENRDILMLLPTAAVNLCVINSLHC